jgi:hypothetical protein
VPLNLFKLEKLTIEAFSDVERSSSVGRMEVMFNPTTYSEKYAPVYQKVQGLNADGKQAGYVFTPPGNLALTLIFDGTGVNFFGAEHALRAIRGESVAKDVDKFKKLCLDMNGSIHQPNFLKVRWGPLKFPCRLASLDISYKRFDRSGEPLHAELAVSFVSDEAAKTLVAKPNKTSPDLTHLRVVKSGDTLPLLCKEIYGSSRYYLRVAADNGLDDFRHLVPGQKLRFAPLPSGQE